jgi:hypothetical protein
VDPLSNERGNIAPMRTANAKLRFEAEQTLIRFEHVIKLQMAEIAKLRTENKRLLDWIQGNTDALTCLQGIYQNPESSEFSKIKAATGALPFERPKLSVAVSVRGSDVLGECLDAAKAMKTINPPKTKAQSPYKAQFCAARHIGHRPVRVTFQAYC